MILVGCSSDKGKVRKNNEDACLVLQEEQVYIVADGVGGNKAGEVASETAVTEIADYIKRRPIEKTQSEKDLGQYLKDCVENANESVFRLGEKYVENMGMATTLTMCYIEKEKAYFVNVGDSRAYIYRGDEIFQVTEDHTYVNSLVKLGVITQDEARNHKKGNFITRAMGANEEIEADFYQTTLKPEDIIILCTDGLYGEIKEEEMCEMIEEEQEMQSLAEKLTEKANISGGRDNITVLCLKYMGGKSNE